MAILHKPEATGPMIRETAPEGVFIATCVAVEDKYNVERQKYQSDKMETVNLTRFYFGLENNGKKYLICTFRMKLSLHENAALTKFLNDWIGSVDEGFDTEELIGHGAQIRIKHVESSKGDMVYANITSISEVMKDLADKVVPVSGFAELLSNDGDGSKDDDGEDAPY